MDYFRKHKKQKKRQVKQKQKKGCKQKFYGSYGLDGKIDEEKLKENIKNNLEVEENDIESEDGIIRFSLDEYEIIIEADGTVNVEESDDGTVRAKKIIVGDLDLNGEKTKNLVVTTEPKEITEELVYTSQNSNIAVVDNEGVVTGVSEGTVKIEVKGRKSKVKGECIVTVGFGLGIKVSNTNKQYNNQNETAVIPVGFSIVPGLDNISEGLVISDDANDTEVSKDNIIANGNQFVWIPCTEEQYDEVDLANATAEATKVGSTAKRTRMDKLVL